MSHIRDLSLALTHAAPDTFTRSNWFTACPLARSQRPAVDLRPSAGQRGGLVARMFPARWPPQVHVHRQQTPAASYHRLARVILSQWAAGHLGRVRVISYALLPCSSDEVAGEWLVLQYRVSC